MTKTINSKEALKEYKIYTEEFFNENNLDLIEAVARVKEVVVNGEKNK